METKDILNRKIFINKELLGIIEISPSLFNGKKNRLKWHTFKFFLRSYMADSGGTYLIWKEIIFRKKNKDTSILLDETKFPFKLRHQSL